MTTTEIDIGAVIAAVIALVGGIGYYLRASGKWREFQTKRAERKDAAAEEARVAEMARTGALQARVDELVDAALSDLRGRVSKLEEENGALRTQVDDLQAENHGYKHSLATMEDALTRAHNDRATETARWRDTQEALERDIATLRQRVESLESELDRKTTELDAVRADQRNYKAALHEMELYKVRLEANNESLVSENAKLAAMFERVMTMLAPAEPRVLGAGG